MRFKPSKDMWIVGILFVFTFVVAYISSLQQLVCIDPVAGSASVWDLTSWPIKVVLFQLLLVFGLYAYSASRRFRSPVQYAEEPPRAQSEYVYSLASLVRRAGKRTLVIDTLAKRFRHDLERMLGLNPGTTESELLNALQVQHANLEPQVRDILSREVALHSLGDRAQLADLMAWARDIADIRSNWRRAT